MSSSAPQSGISALLAILDKSDNSGSSLLPTNLEFQHQVEQPHSEGIQTQQHPQNPYYHRQNNFEQAISQPQPHPIQSFQPTQPTFAFNYPTVPSSSNIIQPQYHAPYDDVNPKQPRPGIQPMYQQPSPSPSIPQQTSTPNALVNNDQLKQLIQSINPPVRPASTPAPAQSFSIPPITAQPAPRYPPSSLTDTIVVSEIPSNVPSPKLLQPIEPAPVEPDYSKMRFTESLPILMKLGKTEGFLSAMRELRDRQKTKEFELATRRTQLLKEHATSAEQARQQALREGKKLNERTVANAFDAHLETIDRNSLMEWDRLLAFQQKKLAKWKVPTFSVTRDSDALALQKRVMDVLIGLLDDEDAGAMPKVV